MTDPIVTPYARTTQASTPTPLAYDPEVAKLRHHVLKDMKKLEVAEAAQWIRKDFEVDSAPSVAELEKMFEDEAAGCGCLYAAESWHDWLLALEDRGFPGLIDLLARLDADANPSALGADSYPFIDSQELEDFVGQHNWKNPAAMHRLAEHVDHYEAMRSDRRAAKEAARPAKPADADAEDLAMEKLMAEVARLRDLVDAGWKGAEATL